jgi:hypothetical protein
MNDNKHEIEQLNALIIAAYNNHYIISPTGLINPKESPNGNQIYHLYSTGEISFQKGGWAYMQRSEFMTHGNIPNYKKLDLKFPKKAADDSTYVILREEECKNFRIQMVELIKKLN